MAADVDYLTIEHREQHTDECLKRADKMGSTFCLARCADERHRSAPPPTGEQLMFATHEPKSDDRSGP